MDVRYEITFSRRRSISIQIPSGFSEGIVVKAPYGMSKEKVLEFIEEKRPWLTKKLHERQLIEEKVKKMGAFTSTDIAAMKKKAKVIIPQRVAYYGQLGNFCYNRIFIKLQKTIWGSCSAGKNLNFNCLLVLMPPEVLDAVVVHELCHLRHMNHSRAFYNEVISLFPEYKKWDKWLKDNGGVYLGRAAL